MAKKGYILIEVTHENDVDFETLATNWYDSDWMMRGKVTSEIVKDFCVLEESHEDPYIGV